MLSFLRKKTLPVIHMTGEIKPKGDIDYKKFNEPLTKAFEAADKEGCVAIIINSPGGSPTQSEMLATKIRELSKAYDVPVLAFVEDYAASGGYWIACAADEIYAMNTSTVGSIGVIGGLFNFKDLMEKYGIRHIQLTAGKDKAPLSPFGDVNDEDVKKITDQMLTPLHESFKNWVSERRGENLPENKEEIFSARVWTGESAMAEESGLIDGIGTYDTILADRFDLEEEFKIKDFTPKAKKRGLRGLLSSDVETREKRIVDAVADEISRRLGLPDSTFDIR